MYGKSQHGHDLSADYRVRPYTYWQTTMRILFPNKVFEDPAGPAMNFRETVPPDGLMRLEEAVHKMTQLNAVQMGIAGRGVLESGAFADIVIFDPDTVADRATVDRPRAPSVGIDLVMVNGEAVYRNGVPTDARPGRIVRRNPP